MSDSMLYFITAASTTGILISAAAIIIVFIFALWREFSEARTMRNRYIRIQRQNQKRIRREVINSDA